MNSCLECSGVLSKGHYKFCSRKHQDTFNQRLRRKLKSTTVYLKTCLQCGTEIEPPRRQFCCRNHQLSYNNKHLYRYEAQKAYRMKSVRNYMSQLRSYYNRKETLSLDFLDQLYDKQQGKCAITGEILTFIQNGGKVPTNISIDRIDSSKGYEPENIQLVCHRVNSMKSDQTLEELKDWCHKILNISKT